MPKRNAILTSGFLSPFFSTVSALHLLRKTYETTKIQKQEKNNLPKPGRMRIAVRVKSVSLPTNTDMHEEPRLLREREREREREKGAGGTIQNKTSQYSSAPVMQTDFIKYIISHIVNAYIRTSSNALVCMIKYLYL